MKDKLKLSERDKKLLFFLLILILVAVSYFFIYQKNLKLAEKISNDNITLKARVDELSGMMDQAENKKMEIKSFENQIAEIKDKFPAALYMEDIIIFMSQLEKAANIRVSTITVKSNELFYPSATENAANAQNTVAEGKDPAIDNKTGTAVIKTPENAQKLTGYKTTITIAYKTTYAGLKKVSNFVQNNSNRMAIGDLTAAYDNSTGNLMGNITINIYTLTGTDKIYEPPFMKFDNNGRNNIFGTIEKIK